MIYIFHGDNEADSRKDFNSQISQYTDTDTLKVDNKNIDLDQINNFINGQSFFYTQKTISFSNFFSISKPILDKLIKIISTTQAQNNIIIWQDKLLNATQLKTFPQSVVKSYKTNNIVFSCLNEIRPGNLRNFIPKLHLVYKENMYDLFLYLAKNSIRKQLTSYSKFKTLSLEKTYKNLIELDFQNKNGTLTTHKFIAMERIFINLLNNP